MDDDAVTGAALLTADLLIALDRERALTMDLTTDLDAVCALLSEALTLIQRQTIRVKDQAEQIRQLMGLLKYGDGWHPPIRLVDVQDVEIPEGMVRMSEIRWTPSDGG
jgi:hypothetical protein